VIKRDRRRSRELGVEQDASHDHALELVGALVDLGDLSPGRDDLVIYQEKAGKQRKYVSVVLARSHLCPASDGLETA
jgi:hypothetical protein